MNKPPRRKSATKSRRSSSRSVISNLERSGNDVDVNIIRRDKTAVPPSDIPSVKWREIIKDEEQDSLVNSIREEIIASAMDVIYDRYLKKTSYDFVVHCSHRAWLQFFDLINLKHDPGENVQTIAENWSYDEAPDPVPPDPWACRRMTVRKDQLTSEESKPCRASVCSTEIDVDPLISVPLFTPRSPESENSHQLSNTEDLTEKNEKEHSKPDMITELLLSSVVDDSSSSLGSLSQRGERSIFTRTISMVKANLPVVRWQSQQRFKHSTHTGEKSFRTTPEAVLSPKPLDLQTLPADR